MSKALEILEKAKNRNGLPLNELFAPITEKEITIIEKELKFKEEIGELCTKYHSLYEMERMIKTEKEQALETLKNLFIFDFALRYPNNQPMLMITNNLTFDYWEIPINQEQYDLLKEILYVQEEKNRPKNL